MTLEVIKNENLILVTDVYTFCTSLWAFQKDKIIYNIDSTEGK